MKKMKQLILTPEWVLKKIPILRNTDGNGNVSVYTESIIDAHFIELALNTLEIKFEQQDCLEENDDLLFGYNFRLEDVKNDCPFFYEYMREFDIRKHGRYL